MNLDYRHMTPITYDVPRETLDPIQHLLDNGESRIGLAVRWGFKTTDTIYRLQRFEYAPPSDTAQKMGESFGWTAGEVIDYWLPRVAAKREEKAS
jgi:hypothetical protein